MRLYLAAKFSKRAIVLVIAKSLTRSGHQVQARWLTNHVDDGSPEIQSQWAMEDLEDLEAADRVIVFQLPLRDPEPSVGRHIELGYALGRGKPVVLVGDRNCVFHHLPIITHFSTITTFLDTYAVLV